MVGADGVLEEFNNKLMEGGKVNIKKNKNGTVRMEGDTNGIIGLRNVSIGVQEKRKAETFK